MIMEFIYVDSDNVDQIAYDEEHMEVHVIFKRGSRHYIYSDVPADVYRDFANAPSKGRFVNDILKGRGCPCRPL
jgi:hypothetical protein